MREADLPAPGLLPGGQQLRRIAANAISALEVVAPKYAEGKHPDAAKLNAFFVSCSLALSIGNPLTWQGEQLTWQGEPLTWSGNGT